LKIDGSIDPGVEQYWLRVVEEARSLPEAQRPRALWIELDTPGGLLSSTKSMVAAMDRSAVPVIVTVSPAGASATSAGALLLLGAHAAGMAKGARVGAAHPVDSSGKDVPGAMGEKVLSDTTAMARGLAQARGRDVKLAEEMVTKSVSLTSDEALERGLIDAIGADREAMFTGISKRQFQGRSIDLRASAPEQSVHFIEIEMHPGEKILHTLANPNVASLLMTLGMAAIYFELSSPGIGIGGIVGAVSLLVAFTSFQMIPTRWAAVGLVLAGLFAMVLEIFVTSYGALAILGALALSLGMMWLVDPVQSALQVTPVVYGGIAGLLLLLTLSVSWLIRSLKRRTLEARQEMGGGGDHGFQGYSGVIETIQGREGFVHIRGESWSYRTEEELQVGDVVEVLGLDGWVLKVRRKGK
jgi:membrane-bound serine protease (ClpP class)